MSFVPQAARAVMTSFALLLQISIPSLPSIPHVPSVPGLPSLPRDVPLPPMLKPPPDSIVVQPAQRLRQVAELDNFAPVRYVSLTGLPRTASGAYSLLPGAYELTNQSFCLRAGGHGPSTGSAYYAAGLNGSRAAYVHDVVAHWPSHPAIPQSDVQQLLWAITSQTKISGLRAPLQSAAHQLLSGQQIDQLNGGALGSIRDLLQATGAQLPAPVAQMLSTESQLRDVLTRGNASYQEIAALAVPAVQAQSDQGRNRWSFDPRGFFIRYLPANFWTTTIDIYAPPAYIVVQDAQGRVTSLEDSSGNRLDIAYGPAPAFTLRELVQYPGFGAAAQRVALGTGEIAAAAVLSNDHTIRAVDAVARSAERLLPRAKVPFFDTAGAKNFLRGAVPSLVCAAAGGCRGSRVASLTLVALGSDETGYDPSTAMAAPANASNQPLAQSGLPAPHYHNVDCDRVRDQLAFAEDYQKKYSDPGTVAAAQDANWSGSQFEEAVNQKAWGQSQFGAGGGGGSGESSFFEGGFTDFTTCEDTYPTIAQVAASGLPPIMFTVIKEHEEKHVLDCRRMKAAKGKDDWRWRQQTEIDAYQRNIDILRNWIAQNCN